MGMRHVIILILFPNLVDASEAGEGNLELFVRSRGGSSGESHITYGS